MALASVVQWWEEWQLRILVLGSLGVQLYLSFGSRRKSHILPLHRFSIWIAYLSGDALAIYALAILYNRQRKLHYTSGSHDLEVLWAPILLIHLGGQMCISAHNIEDNELWRRHVLTAVSQVVVSLYVFFKSWPSSADKNLLGLAIILFMFGVFKCFDKPLALKRSSFNNIAGSFFHPAPRTKTKNRELELEEYIQEARKFMQDCPTLNSDERRAHKASLSIPSKLFVDFAYTYPERLVKFKTFWLDMEPISLELSRGVSRTFDIIYTKHSAAGDIVTLCSLYLWIVQVALSFTPIMLFHVSNKEAYRGSDIKVTFVLLYTTYFVEMSSFFTMGLEYDWHDMVAQRSLLELLAQNKRHTTLMRIVECLQCKGLLHQYFCFKSCDSARFITGFIHSHVREGWVHYIRDVESYWKFSDIRGHWTLDRNGCSGLLRESIEKPFDESVVLWHVATEFCFQHQGTSSETKVSKQISNYMLHLLFANPEMLMPGTRRSLFTDAYGELEAILRGDDVSLLDEKQLTEKIIDKMQYRQGFIHDAWVLAQELIQFGDVMKMWRVIKGVWVEMLCFSAGRCRGYLHAKSLGSGGEYLTFVSLLMSHGGLETFLERQQRIQLRILKEERVRIAKEQVEEAARNQASRTSAYDDDV
ncbi:unnamed protein product [Urochloa decumbens]|uniref:DUF4220 domain-containing protein n=1 Tax=Urochloa decumbens TaxID=240449 RepID=A0ABC9BXE0_9POAL